MAFLAVACILLLLADEASSYSYVAVSPPYTYAPYKYAYLSPPHHRSRVHHPSSHVHKAAAAKRFTAVVEGHVYCDLCQDGRLREPLSGVTVGVICWNGNAEYSFYGTSNKLGNFKVKLGRYDYHKHGGSKSCHVKLISPSYASSCTVPTNLHGGKLGAHLQMSSKSLHELILKAGPFSYTPPVKNKKCNHSARTSTSLYKHDSMGPYSQATYASPSCPAYNCKSTIPPSDKLGPSELITNKHKKSKSSRGSHKALPPNSQGFIYHPSSFYLESKKKF